MSCNSPTCKSIQAPPAFATTASQRRSRRTRSIWSLLKRWYDRCQQRYDLAELDDRRLDDIGLRREEVVRQTNKPFWIE